MAKRAMKHASFMEVLDPDTFTLEDFRRLRAEGDAEVRPSPTAARPSAG